MKPINTNIIISSLMLDAYNYSYTAAKRGDYSSQSLVVMVA